MRERPCSRRGREAIRKPVHPGRSGAIGQNARDTEAVNTLNNELVLPFRVSGRCGAWEFLSGS